MKCPNCGKGIRPEARVCPHCKTHLIRKSDKMARKMTVNSAAAMACGGLLIALGVVMAFFDSLILALIIAAVGIALLIVGKALK